MVADATLTVLRDWADEHYHEVEAVRLRFCGETAADAATNGETSR